jgi:hypothetical protein
MHDIQAIDRKHFELENARTSADTSHGFLAVRSWSSVHLVPIGVVGLGATAVADVLLQVVSPSSGHHQGRRDGRGGAGASHGGLLAQAPLPCMTALSKQVPLNYYPHSRLCFYFDSIVTR